MPHDLYLECKSGVSGDMVVGALIGAGADAEGLRRVLAGLPVGGFHAKVGTRVLSGIAACDFDVVMDDPSLENRDHDMDYLYGDLDGTAGGHGSHEGPEGLRHASSGAGGHAGRHRHRSLAEVLAVVDAADLSVRARGIARRVFGILGEAEAQAHGVGIDQVLLHEVGATDSIVDVIACAYCLDNLDVGRVFVSPLYEGTGRVRTQHGVLPVPVPAVAAIVARYGLTLEMGDREGEYVTPTGAAICAALSTGDSLPAHLRIDRVGVGSGKRAYDPPSFVRAMLVSEVEGRTPTEAPGHTGASAPHAAGREGLRDGEEEIWKLECDVDDCTAEAVGYALAHLLEAGAREAHALPLTMKSSRPGVQLQVICDEAHREELEGILFSDTTTIGVRRVRMLRTVLPRTTGTVTTRLGEASVKRVTLPDGTPRAYPEHREVARLARQAHVGYQDAWRAVLGALDEERERRNHA
ncbi:MAG: nickel pincer cofactor biosynthesis protein LarC [Coriobacteriales bacterium]|jgi:uncharacterized protein (TIGR00299 family) protein